MHRSEEKCVRTFVAKPEGKRPFRRPKSRWEDTKMDPEEMVRERSTGLTCSIKFFDNGVTCDA